VPIIKNLTPSSGYFTNKSSNKRSSDENDLWNSIHDESMSNLYQQGEDNQAANVFWNHYKRDEKDDLTTVSLETSSMNSKRKIDPAELSVVDSPEVRDFKNLIHEMELEVSTERTYVFVAAINTKDEKSNKGQQIVSRSGSPFGGYVYDNEHDSYYIECVEFMDLGFVSCSFSLSLPGVGNWKCAIPLNVSSVKDHLNVTQSKNLDAFNKKFKGKDYKLQFIQMRSV